MRRACTSQGPARLLARIAEPSRQRRPLQPVDVRRATRADLHSAREREAYVVSCEAAQRSASLLGPIVAPPLLQARVAVSCCWHPWRRGVAARTNAVHAVGVARRRSATPRCRHAAGLAQQGFLPSAVLCESMNVILSPLTIRDGGRGAALCISRASRFAPRRVAGWRQTNGNLNLAL